MYNEATNKASLDYLIGEATNHKVDYPVLIATSHKKLVYTQEKQTAEPFINVIIGCRGRTEFSPLLYQSLNNAIGGRTDIIITIVEHSIINEHESFYEDNTNIRAVNYELDTRKPIPLGLG